MEGEGNIVYTLFVIDYTESDCNTLLSHIYKELEEHKFNPFVGRKYCTMDQGNKRYILDGRGVTPNNNIEYVHNQKMVLVKVKCRNGEQKLSIKYDQQKLTSYINYVNNLWSIGRLDD